MVRRAGSVGKKGEGVVKKRRTIGKEAGTWEKKKKAGSGGQREGNVEKKADSAGNKQKV